MVSFNMLQAILVDLSVKHRTSLVNGGDHLLGILIYRQATFSAFMNLYICPDEVEAYRNNAFFRRFIVVQLI